MRSSSAPRSTRAGRRAAKRRCKKRQASPECLRRACPGAWHGDTAGAAAVIVPTGRDLVPGMETRPELPKGLQMCQSAVGARTGLSRDSVPGTATRPEAPSTPVERPQQVSRRAGSVRVLGLPLVAELRDGSLLPRWDEDRVVAEAFVTSWLFGDPAFEDAGAAQLLAGRRHRDQLADVAGVAPFALDIA